MKCYARNLGNCSRISSREHFISEAVLEIEGTSIEISGFPWQNKGESAVIGKSSLASKILCKYHNEKLSPLDESGRVFLQTLKSVSLCLPNRSIFSEEEIFLDGNNFELWFLKIFCGLCSLYKDIILSDQIINILFGKEPFPEKWGLYIFGEEGKASWGYSLFKSIPVYKNNQIVGMKFGIGGLAFILAFGKINSDNPNMKFIFRPKKIVFEMDGKLKSIILNWNDEAKHGEIQFRIDEIIHDSILPYTPIA